MWETMREGEAGNDVGNDAGGFPLDSRFSFPVDSRFSFPLNSRFSGAFPAEFPLLGGVKHHSR